MLILAGKILNDLPGFVFGAVVYEHDAAFLADLALADKVFDLFQKHPTGDGQNFLFVVAGDNNCLLYTSRCV